MELKTAINERKSVRGYKPDTVSKDIIKEVLTLATRAVSAVNCQPWEFLVITGEILQDIKKANMEDLHLGREEDKKDSPLPAGIYTTRSKEIGKSLLIAMDIKREDMEGRRWWMERGYRFFDAPAVIILMMDNEFDEAAYRLEMGCVAQNICLAALEYGLGTCVENQAVTYQRGLKHYLNIPENKRFVTGIAIGYPDDEFKANHVRSTRADIDEITSWYGF